ncbi:MAG: hypothetical protein MJZ16_14135 [Bacteroidales bacterium]|nr:hypothetical protein [Bacteroidales bacterium]
MEEMRECPYCGQKPTIVQFARIKGGWYYIDHECKDYRGIYNTSSCFTEEEAVMKWNLHLI